MHTDQNLLFGVLALRLQLLDDTQFASACTAWAADPVRPLSEVLVARGWVTAEGRQVIEQRIAPWLEQPVSVLPVSLRTAAAHSAESYLETLPPPRSGPTAQDPVGEVSQDAG